MYTNTHDLQAVLAKNQFKDKNKYHFASFSLLYIKTEQKIKQFLAGLPDNQIKKLFDGVEISPFPLLLTLEYEKRFGKKNKKMISLISSKLRQEQIKQRQLLKDFHIELKKLEQLTVSVSGVEKLSKKSIERIQFKRTNIVQKLLILTADLEKINKSILLRENGLLDMKTTF